MPHRGDIRRSVGDIAAGGVLLSVLVRREPLDVVTGV